MTVTLTFFRSSITRLSVDDKALRTKEVSSQERDLLLHKSVIPETIPEKKDLPSKSFIITTPTEGDHPLPSQAVVVVKWLARSAVIEISLV